jgi:antirestriction protein ArdC
MTVKNNHSELIDQLTEGIANLTSSERWLHYLDFQSRFHRYSFGNVLLIATQRHEATRVAGFNAWKRSNRFVRKGEKAIWILAPMVYKSAETDDGESDRVIRGFKFVPVFDVAQTDGEELPSVCSRIDGDDAAGHYAQLVTVAESIGFSVEDHEFGGSANGDCSHCEHRIRVEIHNSGVQRVKTLAHEIAHALIHESYESRALAELEAESVAYVVCRSLGIDSSDYSFGYVATWAGGADEAISAIRGSCERIQKSAATIMRVFELPIGDQENEPELV